MSAAVMAAWVGSHVLILGAIIARRVFFSVTGA